MSNLTGTLKNKNGDTLFPESRKLVAQATANGLSTSLTVTGLDIVRDENIYDIVIQVHGTGTSILVIPGESKYKTCFMLLTNDTFIHDEVENCLDYVTGWQKPTYSMWLSTGTLVRFDSNWVQYNSIDSCGGTGAASSITSTNSAIVKITGGGCYGDSVTNITQLSLQSQDGNNIGAGSYIRVYKR